MTLRIVYTDVDGTLVGPRGSFFTAADGSMTLEPARTLAALHTAGIPVVLVSGRSRAQLTEASLLLGASGFIAELGGLVGWAEGFRLVTTALPGVGAPADDELVTELCSAFPLALYAPWHEGHEVDVLLRGHAEPEAVETWLADRGHGHLRLRDNGIVGQRSGEDRPAHVFHLLPAGISKGAAVAWDLDRRGIVAADALAVGDSVSDLEMASAVGAMALVANALDHPTISDHPALQGGTSNVHVTGAAMGLGWAEAVTSALVAAPGGHGAA